MTSSGARHSHRTTGSFVGRGPELEELCAALDEISERGRLFLISGEPGIGKIRLADEFGTEARRRVARVLWGRCWEGGGVPAYRPWIQVIRSCLTFSDTEQRRAVLDSELAPAVVHEVARIVIELRPSVQPAGAARRVRVICSRRA